MRSIKCGSCGLFNWAESGLCKRCGAQLDASYDDGSGYSNYNQQQQTYYASYPSFAGVQVQRKSGLAVTSMVLGIISILPFTIGGFLGVGAITGIVLGIVAFKKSRKRPSEYSGGGMAVAGIVLSSFALLIMIPIIAAIAIPNLIASRRAANEGSALSALRTIQSAEEVYQSTVGDGRYASMEELVRANLVSPEMLRGQKNGYRFVVRSNDMHFEAVATPITYGVTGTGKRSFYVSEDGVIRGGDRVGMEATASDPPYDPRASYNERAASRPVGSFPVVDEASVVSTLRNIHAAEASYSATDSHGYYGSMQDLVDRNFIRSDILDSRSGYRFDLRVKGTTFEALATPVNYAKGRRSFYISDNGVIRAADRGGYEATYNDPPYDANSASY
ncbi:MAG: hypothetical protein AUG51_15500 [Acidobacteria bacterium 13_1_20CM_3_53_8]|nr:MAG: hypothetical protein AUG51_15500 [Acidobacteria bacterium 13_1_20CM_3_53_8]